MQDIQIIYKGKIYRGTFKIKGKMVVAYYNGKSKGTNVMGSLENIKANENLAKWLLEDLIRPLNERPTYLRK